MNDEDKELLIMASRAADYGVSFSIPHGVPAAFANNGRFAEWNPIDDDGDNQRLRVKMRVEIQYVGDDIIARVRRTNEQPFESTYLQHSTDELDDRYNDERMAVVNAVAMIGRKLA
jgi:hypothetical protein